MSEDAGSYSRASRDAEYERPFGASDARLDRGARRSLERTRARACACLAFCRRRVPGRTRTPRAWTPPSRDAVQTRRPADCGHCPSRKRRSAAARAKSKATISRFPVFRLSHFKLTDLRARGFSDRRDERQRRRERLRGCRGTRTRCWGGSLRRVRSRARHGRGGGGG